MKKLTLALSMILSLSAAAAFAASGHEGHRTGMSHSGIAAHEEVVEGVKATFKVQTMAEAMKNMGMEMPKGVKETHHISVEFKDIKSGKMLTEGVVKLKVQSPDKSEQIKDLMAMHGHFGADFTMPSKGRYGVMSKFKLKDGRVRQAKFWYTAR